MPRGECRHAQATFKLPNQTLPVMQIMQLWKDHLVQPWCSSLDLSGCCRADLSTWVTCALHTSAIHTHTAKIWFLFQILECIKSQHSFLESCWIDSTILLCAANEMFLSFILFSHRTLYLALRKPWCAAMAKRLCNSYKKFESIYVSPWYPEWPED